MNNEIKDRYMYLILIIILLLCLAVFGLPKSDTNERYPQPVSGRYDIQ